MPVPAPRDPRCGLELLLAETLDEPVPLPSGIDPAFKREQLQGPLHGRHRRDALDRPGRDFERTMVEPVRRPQPIRGQEAVVVPFLRERFERLAGLVEASGRLQCPRPPVAPPFPGAFRIGHRGDALHHLVPLRVQRRRRDAPPQRVHVGMRGIDAPEPFDRPRITFARERQPDPARNPGARRGTEVGPLLHRRERLRRGVRVEARQALESVREDRFRL